MTAPTSERVDLARRARVHAIDDATPSAEQSAEWASERGARSERDAVRDVRRIWRDERGPAPRTVATISGRRTMVSPLASTPDDDGRGGYALLQGLTGDESGMGRTYSRPSGAPVHHGRSEQGEALSHHETRPRRSRKGRSTFDVLAHHARPRPVTSEPSGFDGLTSLELIDVADSLLKRAGVNPVEVSGSAPDGKRATYLLGVDAHSTQWAQMVRDDRSAQDRFNVAIHHTDLLAPFRGGRVTIGRNVVLVVHGHRGVVHAGAVRSPGSKRATWRPTVWHTSGPIADTHLPAPTVRPEVKLTWNPRLRIRGTIRKAELATWERLAPGQYVRRASVPPVTGYGALAMRALVPTICLAWHADVRAEREHPATIVRDSRDQMVDRRRARVAVGSEQSEHAWHGHALTTRPSKVSGTASGRTEQGKARKVAADRARDAVPESARTMTDADAERIVREAVAAGTLTLKAQSQGRLSVTHKRADGTVHTWRARNVRAVAARIAQ